MNNYEVLLAKISKELPVVEVPLTFLGYEGNFYDGVIFIDPSLSDKRKREVLSEEYAHYKTSVGNIVNYDTTNSRKQEWKARRYSAEMIVTLDDLIECHEHGLSTIYECADYLDISMATLKDVLRHYQSKFDLTHHYKDKTFIFSDENLIILDKKIS